MKLFFIVCVVALVLAQDDPEPDYYMEDVTFASETTIPETTTVAAPADSVPCNDPMVGGACGEAEACLSSGSYFDLDPSIKCDTDEQVCCRPATTCTAVTLDGTEKEGKCVGKAYCESQGKTPLDGICSGAGDVGCCVESDPNADSMSRASSSALSPCQVAGYLRGAGFPESAIAKLVCTAKHESSYTCSQVGRTNNDGTVDYGLFQVNSRYWCSGGPRSPARGDCGISCQEALDCTKNARCAKTVYDRQGMNAWYGYRSFKRECDSYVLPAECRNGGGGNPNPNPDPDPQPQPGGGSIRCSYSGSSGTCEEVSTCNARGGVAKASRVGATGCQNIPSASVQCCIPSSVPIQPNARSCSYGGNSGLCLPTEQCTGGKQHYKSSQGASGCGSIPDPNVQCCVQPPKMAMIPVVSAPAGRACALARPSGCASFTGKQMTINVQFADEVIRVNAHARNANIKIYITDSFRTSSVSYGAGKSRHKAGFAIDMNANSCNADCMCNINSIRNAGAKAFLQAVMADSTLHWGGDPRSPIPWTVGSCSKDSVHIQSREYQAGSNYDSVVRCLNSEYSAGRFTTFSCAAGASLLNDDTELGDHMDEPIPDSPIAGDNTGLYVGIAIGAIVFIALVAGGVFFVVRRATPSVGGISVKNEFAATATDDVPAVGTGLSVKSSSRVESGTTGEYVCSQCQKSYAFAEDLAAHVKQRH